MKAPSSVDEYIASFPVDTERRLQEMRSIIHRHAPDAKEGISYGMPSYKGKRILFYFGGFKNHISFFPTSSGIVAFASDFKDYKISKGTIQFPLTQDLPEELLRKVIQFRIQEDRD